MALYSGGVSEEKSTDVSTSATTGATTELATESHDPAVPEAYSAFMRTGWDDRERELPTFSGAARAAERRERLAALFPGERLVLPGGGYKVRSYDTDYRFRPDTAHAYFTGNQTSDAVLVVEDGESVLYARPRSGRETDEFFRDRQYGELWVGKRPSLGELSAIADSSPSEGRLPTHSSPYCRSRKNSSVSRPERGRA